jgi:hypothetical protein
MVAAMTLTATAGNALDVEIPRFTTAETLDDKTPATSTTTTVDPGGPE